MIRFLSNGYFSFDVLTGGFVDFRLLGFIDRKQWRTCIQSPKYLPNLGNITRHLPVSRHRIVCILVQHDSANRTNSFEPRRILWYVVIFLRIQLISPVLVQTRRRRQSFRFVSNSCWQVTNTHIIVVIFTILLRYFEQFL